MVKIRKLTCLMAIVLLAPSYALASEPFIQPSDPETEDILLVDPANEQSNDEKKEEAAEEAMPYEGGMGESLFTEWEESGYPDDVGFVVYDNETEQFKVGLVDADKARIGEIRSLLTRPENVAFESCKYSQNALMAVQKEIEKEMSKQKDEEVKVYGIGLGWAMINGEWTGFGESGRELRVVVTVDQDIYEEYVKMYGDLYGDKVYVEPGGSAYDDIAPYQGETAEEVDPAANIHPYARNAETSKEGTGNGSWNVYNIVAVVGIAVAAIILMNRNRLALLWQEAGAGGAGKDTKSLARKEVVSHVKETVVEPGEDVYQGILDKMREEGQSTLQKVEDER